MTDRAGHHAGEAIRAARVAAGLSLRALAQSINVSPATVSAIENGKTGLSVARLQDVAAVLVWLSLPDRRRNRSSGRLPDHV